MRQFWSSWSPIASDCRAVAVEATRINSRIEGVPACNYGYQTYGAFAQDDWKVRADAASRPAH